MCRMKFLVLGAAFLVSSVFMFWNLENCFDPADDPAVRDEEFTPAGERHWTWNKLNRKLNGVAKVIVAARDTYGDYPALVGLCEVENAAVLRKLVSIKMMDKLGYGWVHRDSPDARGIDVALLFRKSRFRPLVVRAVPVPTDPPTRDILYVKGLLDGEPVHVLVNHWPSKLGGSAGAARRLAAAASLRACIDSIDTAGGSRETVIIMGDFNATPAEIDHALTGFQKSLPGFENLASPLAAAGEGSIKYRGTWELIDQFWIREARPGARMSVFRPPFLLEPDTGYTGEKPRRTWSGPRYKGGLSDHLPVVLHKK
ncbi:MAG: endonuclease/exonuclease/phosphatase family protein [Bacteroidales bacterium]|nr:endonuclease/exonuclease/phosphatase family protein [Bacteroidales bacterium]